MPIVSNQDTNKSFEVKEGEILYDSLADSGEILPHGCLAGSCGACRIEVLEGAENLQLPSVIERNTVDALREEFSRTKGLDFGNDKIIRLACRTRVLGDVKFRPIR